MGGTKPERRIKVCLRRKRRRKKLGKKKSETGGTRLGSAGTALIKALGSPQAPAGRVMTGKFRLAVAEGRTAIIILQQAGRQAG